MEQALPTTYFGRDLEAMSFAENYHRWIFDGFRPFVGKTVVEIGAGSGNFTQLILAAKPERILAVEPSENMFQVLDARFEAHPVVKPLNATLQSLPTEINSIDTVFYVNVLEHIEDDFAEVRLAYDCLKPGGHLCVFVPALPVLFGTADEMYGHVRRYTARGLDRVVSSVPLTILKHTYFDVAGIIPWFVLFRLLRRQTFSVKHVTAYDRLVVPIMRRVETIIPPPIGKNLFLVARKT